MHSAAPLSFINFFTGMWSCLPHVVWAHHSACMTTQQWMSQSETTCRVQLIERDWRKGCHTLVTPALMCQ